MNMSRGGALAPPGDPGVDARVGAFCSYTRACEGGTDAAPSVPLAARFNVCARASRGLRAMHEYMTASGDAWAQGHALPGAGAAFAAAPAAPAAGARTLADGSLRLGTDLPLLARRYRYVSTLSGGTSSQVIQAEDTYSALRDRVAIKIVRVQYSQQAAQEARLLRYLATPRSERSRGEGGEPKAVSEPCEHIVRLLDAFTFEGHVCLVMERLYGSLSDFSLREIKALPPAQALAATRKVGSQLAAALLFMRRRGVVHADLKPDNVLFADPLCGGGGGSMRLKVADFGNAFTLAQAPQLYGEGDLQTLDYRAPEVLLGARFGCEIDAWSAGVALAELALGRPCFSAGSAAQLLNQITSALGAPPPADLFGGGELYARTMRAAGLSPSGGKPSRADPSTDSLHTFVAKTDRNLADLVARLLTYDPAARATPANALLHPFFAPLFPFAELAREVAGATRSCALPQRGNSSVVDVEAADAQGGDDCTRKAPKAVPAAMAAPPAELKAPVAVPAVAADGLQGAPPWLSAKAKTEPETATAATTAVTAAFAADADAEQSGVDDALAGGSAARPAPAVKAEARVAEAGQADASAATSPHSGKRKSGDAGRKRTSTREEERTLRAPPAAVEGLGSKRRRREARSSTPWWVVSKGD